jgi:hypothetical protein
MTLDVQSSEPPESFSLVPLQPTAVVAARQRIAEAEADPKVHAYCRELAPYLARDAVEELAEFERFALLGVCSGFVERDLSPYLPQHVEIVAPLLEEIRAVYLELRRLDAAYDPHEFRMRAFHYGVHKASYLDWRLYGSLGCY